MKTIRALSEKEPCSNSIKEELYENFFRVFDSKNALNGKMCSKPSLNDSGLPKIFFAPGRVNLIGEHLDYNGGAVFPCGLSLGTYIVIRKRFDCKYQFYSQNFKQSDIFSCSLDEIVNLKLDKLAPHSWCNYLIGVISEFINKSYPISNGCDIYVYGTIPNGAGLSSSASFLVATIYAFNKIFNLGMNDLAIIKFARYIENNFIGVNCGIMDQFAVVKAMDNNAIYLKCDTLEYKYAPLKLGDYSLVIANTNKKRKLSESNYNQRFSECQQALNMLKEHLEITSLAQLTPEMWNNFKEIFNGYDNLYKRVNHVVTELSRTNSSLYCLQSGNLIKFGELMYQSHASLRDDYDVTGLELDTIVELAINLPYCIGSRMTGAGRGGCSVNLVKTSHIQDFISIVSREYTRIINIEPSFYIAEVSGGVCEI